MYYLQPQDRPMDVGDAFLSAIREQYASMYLQSIGAFPTPENM